MAGAIADGGCLTRGTFNGVARNVRPPQAVLRPWTTGLGDGAVISCGWCFSLDCSGLWLDFGSAGNDVERPTHARARRLECGSVSIARVVRRGGDRQHRADRLDPIRRAVVVDERHHHFARRSSSACAKYADAFRRISFARFSARTSRSSRLSSILSDWQPPETSGAGYMSRSKETRTNEEPKNGTSRSATNALGDHPKPAIQDHLKTGHIK
jgi:hypothetical protein